MKVITLQNNVLCQVCNARLGLSAKLAESILVQQVASLRLAAVFVKDTPHYGIAAVPGATRVGLAYAGQEVAGLEIEPHDVRLHGVLTEVGYRPFA